MVWLLAVGCVLCAFAAAFIAQRYQLNVLESFLLGLFGGAVGLAAVLGQMPPRSKLRLDAE